MKPQHIKTVDRFSVSLFWLPVAIAFVGAALGIAMPHLDSGLADTTPYRWIESISMASSDGARELLSSGAAALATILAVAFSITMVTQELAAGQYSPLVLRRFVSDRVTQLSLGIYLGSVAYLLFALRAVPHPGRGDEVPQLTVAVGIALILLSLGVIAYFIHHVARSVETETIVHRVGVEFTESLQRLPFRVDGDPKDVPIPPESGWALTSSSAGYLQLVDEERLLECAPPGCRIIRVEMRAGDFLLPDLPLLSLWPAVRPDAKLERALRECFSVGRERTMRQDLLFGIRELVDIALRALSPSMNDPTTAIQALNELGAANEAVMRKGLVSSDVHRLRRRRGVSLLIPSISLRQILAHSFHEIPRAAGNDVRVTTRVLEILADLSILTDSAEVKEALLSTGATVRKAALRENLPPEGRRLLESRWRMLTGASPAVEGGDAPPAIH